MNFDELPSGGTSTTFDNLPDSSPSFLNKVAGVVGIPKKVYEEIALPLAENVTSQVVNLADAGITGTVAVRDYIQGLAGTGSLSKAYEIAKKGAEETPKLSSMFTPSTELGKSSSEISNKLWGIPGEIGEALVDLPLESLKAPKYIRQPVKAVAGLAAYGGVGSIGGFAKNVVRDLLKERGFVKSVPVITPERIMKDVNRLDTTQLLEEGTAARKVAEEKLTQTQTQKLPVTEVAKVSSFDELPSAEAVAGELAKDGSVSLTDATKTNEAIARAQAGTTQTPISTFKGFVESKGVEWPISTKDPKYEGLLKEFEVSKKTTVAEDVPDSVIPVEGIAEGAPAKVAGYWDKVEIAKPVPKTQTFDSLPEKTAVPETSIIDTKAEQSVGKTETIKPGTPEWKAVSDAAYGISQKEKAGTATPEDLIKKQELYKLTGVEDKPVVSRTREEIQGELEDLISTIKDQQTALKAAAGDTEASASIREEIKDTKRELVKLNKELKSTVIDEVPVTSAPLEVKKVKGTSKVKLSREKEVVKQPEVKAEVTVESIIKSSTQPILRASVRVGDEIASSKVEGGFDTEVPLTKSMKTAWDGGAKIETGFVDQDGKWISAKEGKVIRNQQLGEEAEKRAQAALTFESPETPETPRGFILRSQKGSVGRDVSPAAISEGPFYSQLEKIIQMKMGGKMPVDQLRKMLKGNGVTDAEIGKITKGMEGVVTKQRVLEEIKVNGIKFEDVVLGDIEKTPLKLKETAPERWQAFDDEGTLFEIEGKSWYSSRESLQEAIDKYPINTTTYFSSYVEPGAVPGSYRELFVTAPGMKLNIPAEVLDKKFENFYKDFYDNYTATGKYSERAAAERAHEDARNNLNGWIDQQKKGKDWQDGHSAYSDIQNPVVRIRYNVREVNGKKIGFIEEMQGPGGDTKWVGEARGKTSDGKDLYDRQQFDTKAQAEEWTKNRPFSPEEVQVSKTVMGNQGKMPPELQSRIYDIGVKRVLALAKKEGWDGVAWTTGEMQVSRYDLSKHLDAVTITREKGGLEIRGWKDKRQIVHETGVPEEKLADYIGKDKVDSVIAQLNSPDIMGTKDVAELTGLDLKVGGEGLKSLYDKTLPEKFKKFGKGDVREIPLIQSHGAQHLNSQGEVVYEWKNGKPSSVPYISISSKTPSSYTLYSDPFGIQTAISTIKNPEVRKLIKEVGTISDDFLGAISTRLGNIDPSIKYALRKFEYTRGRKAGRREKAILPLIKASDKMSSTDYKLFDIARKNSDTKEIKRLGEKYNIEKELDTLRLILDDIYNEAKAVGFKPEYKKTYHPREVIDSAGLLEHLRGTEDWSTFEFAIKNKEKQLDKYLTIEEKAKVVNSLLRGYAGSDNISLSTPGQLKARTVQLVTPELEKYYANSDSALLRYINDMTDAIEARKFFGKTAKDFEFIDLDNSIGAYVLDMIDKKKMSKNPLTLAQERELTNILKARFNAVGTSGVVGLYKNLAYIDTMGSVTSAVTQLGDVAFSMYKYGIPSAVKSTVKAVVGKSRITRKDLGIERIAAEFSDKSTMGKAVDKVFNAIGLTKIDSIFKETAINAAFDSAIKKTRTAKGEIELKKDLEPIFGKETAQVFEELKEGKVTENTKLYVFNKLADIQPIALSEMPVKYLTGGNGRILYMLKTYTLKMFDVYRQEAFSKIATPGQRVQGIKNLVRLSAYIISLNTGADSLKDLILGRPFDLSDAVINNIYRLAGASRFLVSKGKVQGVGSTVMNMVAPPTKLIDAVSKDITTFGDEKGVEFTKSIPIVGNLYYWWFGKGAEKSLQKEKQILKEKYYRQASKEIKKYGDVTPETIKKVVEDKRLSERDKNTIEKRIEVGDELVYSVMKMPFEKALIALKNANREDQKKLLEVLDDKYERLTEEDQEKYNPKIDKILEDMKKPKFSIRSLLSSGKES